MKNNPFINEENDFLEELPSHIRIKIFRFMKRDMRKLWSSIRSDLVKAPKYLQDLSEQLPEIFAFISPDADLRNRREVYVSIAKFIQEHTYMPLPICLNAVHSLCGETDTDIREDGAIGGEKILESVKNLILTIKVYYEPQDARRYTRRTEIYYLKEDHPAAISFPQQLDWEDVPEDVRENRIHKGMEPEIFKLYPKES